jgi:hypothetical protein
MNCLFLEKGVPEKATGWGDLSLPPRPEGRVAGVPRRDLSLFAMAVVSTVCA